jgi:type IV pilus assembly protein PilM
MSLLSTLRRAPAPSAAVELAAGRVSAATLEWRGTDAVISAHATEPLPAGALTPALATSNLHDRAAILGALTRVLERVGKPKRIGLIIPDIAAKVSLVRFETVPARAQDLDQLVRWQVRKSAPFDIDEAQVSYVPGVQLPDGQEFIVSLARRAVIEEYESLCADAGAQAGLVDLATFNVINAVLAGSTPPDVDWLLVNVAGDDTSIALMRGTDLLFFRNRAADADGTLADLVHQTAMYYEDRLKGSGFVRVLLAGAAGRQAGDVEQVRRSLEDRLTTAVETVDPRLAASIADRITASPALLDTLTPLVGLLLRDHVLRRAVTA